MKPPQHIPTIIAFILLIIGIGSLVFLVERGSKLLTQADVNNTAQNTTISNISDSSFSVSWVTAKKTRGVVSYAKKGNKYQIAIDDRDEENSNPYQAHHVTIRNLEPNALYLFTIISNDKTSNSDNTPYQVQTTNTLSNTSNLISPIYGTAKTQNNQPASDTLVYFSTVNSQILSTITTNNGQFILPISLLRDKSLAQYISLTENTTVSVTVQRTDNQTSHISTPLKNTAPMPEIILGQTYDFHSLKGSRYSFITSAFNYFKTKLISSAHANSAITILQPEPGAGIPSRTPQFRGTGISGKQVIATVGSPIQVGKIWVASDETWSWTPPDPLLPDKHILTITTYDADNNPVAVSRQFSILKSGSSVLQAATPSATPITITPTPNPNPTSTATPSTQPIPISGNIAPTFALMMFGVLFFFGGSVTFAKASNR